MSEFIAKETDCMAVCLQMMDMFPRVLRSSVGSAPSSNLGSAPQGGFSL